MSLSDAALRRLQEASEHPDLNGTRYTAVAPIARGGMGAVWRVHDEALDRDVALKVIHPGLDGEEILRRLEKEARILARLEHPGMVPIHDFGRLADGRVYYAMRWVRSGTLEDWAGVEHPLGELLRVFLRICEPVAYAHTHGVVHRDLKPANVMLGDFGDLLVMDWGVAKLLDEPSAGGSAPRLGVSSTGDTETTLHGARLGTPGYMAPEQERGEVEGIGPRTDVFGLGAILRFLVERREGEPPKRVRAIWEKAMRTDPNDRYASVDLLADDVRRYLEGDAVEAYPEPPWEKAWRFALRYRFPILLVLAYMVMRTLFVFFF